MAVVQVREVEEDLRPATPVVAGEKRVLLEDHGRGGSERASSFQGQESRSSASAVVVHPVGSGGASVVGGGRRR